MRTQWPDSALLTMFTLAGRVGLLAMAADQYCQPNSATHFFAIMGLILFYTDLPWYAASFERFLNEW